MKDKVVICGLSASKELAKSISKKLNYRYVEVETRKFKSGEMLTQINASVRGQMVYVIQSTSYPCNDNIMELLILLDALKRSSAKQINVVIPFYGYSRQDRKAKGRQPITAKLVADMLQVAGAERIITFDLHSSQIQGFFNIPVDDLKTIYLIKDKIKKLNLKNPCVVSPDYGGLNRSRILSKMLNAPLTIIDKRRPSANKSEILNILGEDMKNKDIIVIDDMIDTGGTIYNTLKIAEQYKAKSAHVFCTHGIFSNDGVKKLVSINLLKKIYMTNTIETNIQEYSKITKKLEIIYIDYLLAKVIEAQVKEISISDLYK